ncbi:MAG: histidine phosphatase family protein [Lachnospiraceae bacterium]|nr:histidine phosphatase family protein [Lachnospiraceae bacterium]
MSWLLIRHGMTPGNERRAYIGSTDEPLSADGRAALAKAAALGEYPPADKIYVSPMLRCRQTAEIIYPHVDAVVLDGLKERDFGIYEGKTFTELTSDAAYMKWVNSGGTLPFPGGEDDGCFRQRVLFAFDGIWRAEHRKRVAIIAHGGTIMTIMAERFAKKGEDAFSFQLANGKFFEIPR